MADSKGITDAAQENGKGQSFKQRTAGDAGLNGLMVHRALGIDPEASMEENVAGFKPMTEENENEFTREDIEVWLRTLSVIGRCSDLGACAEEYAQKFVVQAAMNTGWTWLIMEKEFWLANMKRGHYRVLERFGFARKGQPRQWRLSITPVRTRDESSSMPSMVKTRDESINMPSMIKTRDERINKPSTVILRDESLQNTPEKDPHEEPKDTGDYSAERAGDGTLVLKESPDVCAGEITGSSAGAGILEALVHVTSLSQMVDEMRASDGTLEALKQGILNRRKITGDGTMVLQEHPEGCSGGSAGDGTLVLKEYPEGCSEGRAGDGTLVIKEYPEECTKESADDGTPVLTQVRSEDIKHPLCYAYPEMCSRGRPAAGTLEVRKCGLPHLFDGGHGAIMIGADPAAKESSVATGLIIDPGGGGSISTGGGISAGGGKITDNGRGENIDLGGSMIKVHKAEIEKAPHKVEGGQGEIMISAELTTAQKSVARGFLLDPGGGDNISPAGGNIVYPEITGDRQRNSNGEGPGAPAREGTIKDPGEGEDIDIGGLPPDFEKCVDTLVNHEVHMRCRKLRIVGG